MLYSLYQWFPKWAVVPPGGGEITYGGAKGQGALKAGPSERGVLLFTIEVTLNQTLGNWYHFMKPIHRIKHLLTVKWLLKN
jgi:hypothetical protein